MTLRDFFKDFVVPPQRYKLGQRVWFGWRSYGSLWVFITGVRFEPTVLEAEGTFTAQNKHWEYQVYSDKGQALWGWVKEFELSETEPA